MMKVCFVGVGSIGKRHIRNLKKLKGNQVEIHAIRSSLTPLPGEIESDISKQFLRYDEADSFYDAVFVTNPTIMHFDAILNLKDKTSYFFVEKPITENLRYEFDKIANLNIYVACPLRYTQVYQYMKKYLEDKRVFSARAISSSYLPEWRKGQDYRKIYSARKELGGGVNIDLIHEWDYMIDLFGYPSEIYVKNGKYSDLEINSNDLAVGLGIYKDKIIEIHLDYFGRKTQRYLEVFTDQERIIADFIEKTISFQTDEKTVSFIEDGNMPYLKELMWFIQYIGGEVPNKNSLEKACKVLRVSLGEE